MKKNSLQLFIKENKIQLDKLSNEKRELDVSIDELIAYKQSIIKNIDDLEKQTCQTLFEQIHTINFIRELKLNISKIDFQIEQLEQKKEYILQQMKELRAIKKAYEKLQEKMKKLQQKREEKHEEIMAEESYRFHTNKQ
ncbi:MULTISPECIES: hypothetical protein [unclassified Nitratiruptor]|uniref:hypothetical protein n=1 Tax=unclassified Nitratiruptor TaxID=2624044 RepID=UPI001915196C|nr:MULTISPECIES: hypothetical protein [unclassified Nitratiruptor]BCD59937.1 hypothetical protein NitYY0810_C0696 [Nitratiruptor sp. YY08-10]BCD63860.1 hypothetical protein NitYY0814_C0695 [Nitratiruptor sp. YY08-14]